MVARTPDALWAEIPEHMRPGLARWLLDGTIPGSFLSAIIRGDQFVAASLADSQSLAAFGYIALFLHIFTPPESHGASMLILSRADRALALALSLENYPAFIQTLKDAAGAPGAQ
jgi:hypothetical protein